MRSQLMLFPVAMLLSTLVFANGNRVGNGGDVIECPKRTSQVLDLFETPRKITPHKGTYQEILERVYGDLKIKAPKLGNQYLKRSQSILNEIEWTEANLKDIRDSNELFSLPDKCELKQAAVRKSKSSPLSKSFIFQKRIWDSLDEVQKAALMSHEIIYEHFSKLGEKNSRKAREFNALLMSEDFSKETSASLNKILEKYEIPAELGI